MALQVFENKQQTRLEGLWDHGNVYTSASINLAQLKQFKGCCRVMMKRNHSHKKGDRRPSFLFWIVSNDYEEKVSLLEFEDVLNELEDEERETASWNYTEWNDYYMTTIYSGYKCSNCDEKIGLPYNTISEFKYCPYCGAKME